MEHQPATPDVSPASATGRRFNELRAILEGRRSELLRDVQAKIRGARIDNQRERQPIDQGEGSEGDIQDEIEFALIQMSAETLKMIELALRRLDEGTYGNCLECANEISEARLRALSFAVRCKDCEEAREMADQRELHSTYGPTADTGGLMRHARTCGEVPQSSH